MISKSARKKLIEIWNTPYDDEDEDINENIKTTRLNILYVVTELCKYIDELELELETFKNQKGDKK